MFGKKKQTKTLVNRPVVLNAKVAKANELREKANKSQKRNERLVDEWIKRSVNEKDPKKQKIIDDEYAKKISAAENKADEDYAEYYAFANGNFSENDLILAGARGQFMSKFFINKLDKLTKNKKPVKPATGTSASKNKASKPSASESATKSSKPKRKK